VADVNGDGRPDLFVAGYTDLNTPVPSALGGFPSNYQGVRDLLYLNEGNDEAWTLEIPRSRRTSGLEATQFRHGLGALFTDYNGDGRPDLYVADDEDPNQLYENVPWPGGAPLTPKGSASASRSVAPRRESTIRTPEWASRRVTTTAMAASTSS
jgi:FG-GAP repeat.